MSKRPAADSDTVDAPIAPALRDARTETLHALSRMSDCILNPHASHARLMCNDVLDLIGRQLQAPVLCAVTSSRTDSGWCVYDFDSGWGALRSFGPYFGDVAIATITGIVCVEFLEHYLMPFCFPATPIDETAVLWVARLPYKEYMYYHRLPVDDAVLCFDREVTKMIRCAAAAEIPDRKVRLPDGVRNRSISALDTNSFFALGSPTCEEKQVLFDISRYDMHACAISFSADNVALRQSTGPYVRDLVRTGKPVSTDGLFVVSSAGCHSYDTRSCTARELARPYGLYGVDYSIVIVSENLWMLVTELGEACEYDVRGNFWRTPHQRCEFRISDAALQSRPINLPEADQ